MKRYFMNGIATLLAPVLLIWVLYKVYDFGLTVAQWILPLSWQHWWLPIVVIFGVVFFIFLIGLIFTKIKFLKWVFSKFEEWFIGKIPVVKSIYGFGKEVADAFITDIKEDGYLAVIEVEKDGGLYLGVLTDPENNTVFLPTAPNPSNGFLFRTKAYKIVATMEYMEAIQFVVSMGKLNGGKWKNERQK